MGEVVPRARVPADAHGLAVACTNDRVAVGCTDDGRFGVRAHSVTNHLPDLLVEVSERVTLRPVLCHALSVAELGRRVKRAV